MDAWVPPPIFDGYRLMRALGAGGMGRVYLCNDQLLDRLVAVKFIAHPDPDPRRYERFLREGRALARLVHPNVVLTFRVGEVEGKPFLVSEFVHGLSLQEHAMPMHWRRVLEIGIELGRGLAAAHQVGVLHRDVKPANIMLSSDGHVKLIDFGLAKFVETANDAGSLPPFVGPRPIADETESDADDTPPAERDDDPMITRAGSRLGTPRYMAPEILSGQAASQQSDVYSLGCVLYELCHGRLPNDPEVVCNGPVDNAIDGRIDARFAEVINRCLSPDPAQRSRSAPAVLRALEQLASDVNVVEPVPHGNPFRGLQPFESQHRALFLGRSVEVKAIIERMRSDVVVVVAGDSGVGKSSLCKAGVLPLLSESGVQIDRGAIVLRVPIGRDPISHCATVLADFLSLDAYVVKAQLSDAPAEVLRALARVSRERTIVLFFDQIEELFTVSSAEAASAFSVMLASLALSGNQLRILATVRVDFLARLAALPGLGPEVARGPYLLPPLGPDKLREVIVVPATRAGVRFASGGTIDELVRASLASDGSLPLLQFALAELWEARDRASNTIGADTLEQLGGVAGALERHADRVLAALPTEQQLVARRLLLRLVTKQRTRASLPRADLEDRDIAALEVLISGRLVVVRGSESMTLYELAHEAMITRWSTLHQWLDEMTEDQQRLERLAVAAIEWERLGRRTDALWRGRQLTHLGHVMAEALTERDGAFLVASRRARRRTRIVQVAIPTLFAVVVIAAITGARLRARSEIEATVSSQLAEARQLAARAAQLDATALQLRARAFDLFDRASGFQASPPEPRTWETAEATWSQVLELDTAVANLRSRVSTTLEAAILVGPTRDDVRVELARALAVRLELAERMHNRELAGELANRIRTLVAAGAAPASLGMEHSLLTLVGLDLRTTVTLARQRTEPSGLIVEEAATPITEGSHDLAPGSYMVQIVLADKPAVRLPVWLHRGQRETVQLPRVPTSIPDGMIFIPAGQTQVGADEENMRVGLDMPPLHPVQVDAFLIGRFEVTMGQYAEWLDTLDAAERAARLPLNRSQPGAIELRSSASGWTLQLRPTTIEYVVRWGEPLRYRGRSAHAVQDWRRLPVTGISFDDATAFAAWLARGRLRGARLCSELEWTRAARGADDRVFTIGRRLLPGDANFDLTYGGTDVAFGPDEVGSHPKSASMFGVEDLHGNAEEIVRATRWGEATAVYGGSWYHERVQQRLDNRFRNVPSTRHMLMGFRVCSPVP